MSPTNQPTASSPADLTPEWLRLVQAKVESLRFGVVQLTVHDGRVTQIERTEKTRLSGARESDAE